MVNFLSAAWATLVAAMAPNAKAARAAIVFFTVILLVSSYTPPIASWA
jgi:negative regulator of sigma E activity